MDLIQMLMSTVVAPISLLALLLFYPPYLLCKLILHMIRWIFSENVAGKVVLITGASSGIGEQLAYEYAKRGAILVLVARRKVSLQKVADQARCYGSPDVLAVQADASKVEDCKRFIDQALDHFGRLDHLVNNAGITSVNLLEDSADINIFRPIMETNFWGSIYPTHFAIPHLRKSKGKIVVIASVARWLPAPRLSFYNASKAAVAIFFEALRIELAPNVKIMIVTPGLVESEMTKGKFLTKKGKMEVDQELRDVGVGPNPVMSAGCCAKTIVNGACMGDRCLTVPSWYNAIYMWQMLCPEVIEWFLQLMLIPKAGAPAKEALSMKISDVTRAKYFLYPSSILSPEIKQD